MTLMKQNSNNRIDCLVELFNSECTVALLVMNYTLYSWNAEEWYVQKWNIESDHWSDIPSEIIEPYTTLITVYAIDLADGQTKSSSDIDSEITRALLINTWIMKYLSVHILPLKCNDQGDEEIRHFWQNYSNDNEIIANNRNDISHGNHSFSLE